MALISHKFEDLDPDLGDLPGPFEIFKVAMEK